MKLSDKPIERQPRAGKRGLKKKHSVAAKVSGKKHLRFVQGDAQVFPFEPGSFDAAFSRFGVMYFANPTAAFINIRRKPSATRPACFFLLASAGGQSARHIAAKGSVGLFATAARS